MLIKCLLPKSSAFLGRQGKAISRLWSFTVKRFDHRGSSLPQNARIPWHLERHTCMLNVASPIDIITGNTIQKSFDNFKFTGYDSPLQLAMANNGHTGACPATEYVHRVVYGEVTTRYRVTIDLPQSQLKYAGGGMQETYIAHHVHFHFGVASSYGSEHYLDGQRYPMEIQRTSNSNLNPIVDKLKEVVKPYTATRIHLPSMYSLFPHRDLEFYQYAEHFDKPTTYWTVFQKKIHISESQMHQFRKLTSPDTFKGTGDNVPLAANNRFIVHLPDLQVFRSSEASYKKRHLKHVVSGIFRKRTQGMVDM